MSQYLIVQPLPLKTDSLKVGCFIELLASVFREKNDVLIDIRN